MSTPGYMDVETTATRKAPAPKAPEVVEGDFAAFYRKFSYLWSTVLLGFALVVLYYDSTFSFFQLFIVEAAVLAACSFWRVT